MIESEVIIVGGGPAGATCGWKLKQHNVQSLILDKATFPRPKLCAGWITPRVWRDLEMNVSDYPQSILTFRRLNYHFFNRKIPIKTLQYSIRRFEFDAWLSNRSDCEQIQHQVQNIRRENGVYIIDETFRCKYLVGAGGTHCRVYRSFFKPFSPREKENQITTLEAEFPYDYHDPECYLWYFDQGLRGYSWYVPKGNDYLNVGIGGKLQGLKAQGQTIRHHWDLFIKKLRGKNLVSSQEIKPRGYNYYIRPKATRVHIDNAYIIGDAAGLASVDMGEGIGPAIKSGLLAADAIINQRPYSTKSIGKYSFFDVILPRLMARFS